MTTFVDDQTVTIPSQDITVSGQTGIDSIAAGTSSSPAVISKTAARTVVSVTRADGSHAWLQLPSGTDVGDVVEIYQDISLAVTLGAVKVQVPSGEDFGTANSSQIQSSMPVNYGASFRKISSTTWGLTG